MERKRWDIHKPDKELAVKIAGKFPVDPFVALILSGRGITSDDEIADFLGMQQSEVDPFLLPDMQKAVDRINDAIFSFEKILIYGDYDADGITATAILYTYLETRGANVTYMLPDRAVDGYGLSRAVVDKIRKRGAHLIITVDNGIAAIDEAKYIRELGMELIVTDHHLPGDEIPDCVAVVDPHRTDSDCPFQDYCGAGVAFKLCCAIEGDSDVVSEEFIDLAAIGTIADIVPLRGENRRIAAAGLQSLNSFRRPGIEALIASCGIRDREILSSNVSFGLAPRINAAGRMIHAERALELLLSEEDEEAETIAGLLTDANNKRHEAEDKIIKDTYNLFFEHPEYSHTPVIVTYGYGWNEGILGIVASKLLDKFQKPVIVLSNRGDGYARGSARSVEGFSIFDALTACSEYIELFGGHSQAAGMTIKSENIEPFINAITAYAYTLPGFYPSLSVDCKLNTDCIDAALVHALKVMEPFGCENQSPLFGIFGITVDVVSKIGENRQHLRITAHKEGKAGKLTLMYFNTKTGSFPYVPGDVFDAVVSLTSNIWNGQDHVSIIIRDTRPAGTDEDIMVKSVLLYDRISLKAPVTPEEAAFATPDRSLFVRLYTYLKNHPGTVITSMEYVSSKICEDGDNLCRVRVALHSMIELGLAVVLREGAVTLPKVTEKVDLETAPTMLFLKEMRENG